MQGPRLYRFFNYELPMYLPAPTAGWNPDVNPWACPVSQAPQLDNFLLRPGKIVMRAPVRQLASFSGISSTSPMDPCGCIIDGNGIVTIARKASGSAHVDPWNAPLWGKQTTELASGLTSGFTCNNVTGGTGTPLTFTSADYIPGPRWINFDGLLYGISYDSTGAITQDSYGNYYMKPLNLLTYQQNNQAISVLANAPHGAFDLIGYQSRIWLLGGIDTPGGGTTHNPIALYFTNPIAAGGGSASADWKDPVEGTTNVIVMDGDTSDYGVGLATIRGGLIIFRRNSIYLLKGSTTANYTLIPISTDIGCVDARSIVETDDGVYFMSKRGLMLTNGVRVVNMSGSILHTLRTAIKYEQDSQGTGGYICCQATSQGQILVSIGTASGASTGRYIALFTALYDPSAPVKGGGWTRITSNIWTNDSEQQSGNAYAGQLFGYKNPDMLISVGDQIATAFEIEYYGESFVQPESDSYAYYDIIDQSTNVVPIPAIWKTTIPAITTAAKRVIAQGKRYYIDYVFAPGSNYQQVVGWQVEPFDASGVSLDAAQSVPTTPLLQTNAPVSGSYVPQQVLQRYNRDWWPEITEDVQFVVQFADPTARTSPTDNGIAEIIGMGLEFQRARELR